MEFDRAGATYASGETVTGNVIVDVVKEKQIRGLSFSTQGVARVHWTESESVKDPQGRNITRTKHFTNSEEYFHFKYNIIGTQRSDSRTQIPVGYHKYSFNFQLPHNIPSSFEHDLGHIRYTVKASIDRPWKFDHESKAAFTVISSLDLNMHRQKCLGIDDEVTENFCCFCCIHQGSLLLQIKVPTSGYVPGQTISTLFEYTNTSNRVRITKISTKITQKLKFYATSPHRSTRTQTIDVASTKNSGPFSTNGQSATELLVPPTPPSYLEFCGIIDLDYKLVLTVHVSGPHCKITRSYPLLIGTMPLYCPPTAPPLDHTNVIPTSSNLDAKGPAMLAVPMPMPMSVQPPTAPYPITDGPVGGFPQPRTEAVGFVVPGQPSSSTNWDIPPPSYEECMSRTQNIKDQDESNYVFGANDPFAPRYPVFNYPSPSIHNN